ncbi:MAG: right-handed parallel beta-helix repeat-containing protein, partial [Methanomassiliicoccales archaeon]
MKTSFCLFKATRIKRILGCFFSIIVISSPLFAGTVYYVNITGGDDSSLGTSEATAWKTIAKVNSQSFSPGDKILFKRGEVWREPLIIPSSGTAGSPITFGAYGNGNKPVINGANATNAWRNLGSNIWYVISVNEPSQIFFNGVRGNKQTSPTKIISEYDWYWDNGFLCVYSVSNPDTAYANQGVEISDSSGESCITVNGKDYITIENLELKNPQCHGINIWNSDNCIIQDCLISRTTKRGIYAGCGTGNHSNYGTIRRNTIHHCGVELSTPEHGIYIDKGCNSWKIYKNEVYSCWNSGIMILGNNDVKIYQNYLHENNVEHSDGHGDIYLSAWDANISNANVYYNIIKTDTYSIRCEHNGSHTISANIYNNVIYGNGSSSKSYIVYLRYTKGTNFKNNIILSNTKYTFYFDDNSNLSTNYNCYFGWSDSANMGYNETGFVSWAEWNTKEINSINSNPLFVSTRGSGFRLQPDSKCIDIGTDMGLSRDYDGDPVPTGWGVDIGAQECQEETNGSPVPVASFSAYPAEGIPPLEVSFDASASYDPDGNITSYAWDFGDGNAGSGTTVTHTYQNRGTYTAKL